MSAQITDHVNRALLNLLSQFDRSPALRELVTVIAAEIQDQANVLWAVLTQTPLEIAVGVHLDGWGVILGEKRGGLNDGDYRAILSAVAAIHQSDGEAWRTTNLFRRLLGDGPFVRYRQLQPAAYEFSWEDLFAVIDDDYVARIARLALDLRPAGVSHSLVEGPPLTPFQLDVAGRGLDQGKLGRRIDA